MRNHFALLKPFFECVRQRGRICMSEEAEPRPVLQCVAALAMKLGGRHLAEYGATRSRHDFTQRQLMSCLILRAYLKTTYRGVLEHLRNCPALRRELGLEERLPHYSTLAKFSTRSQVLQIADAIIQQIGRAAVAADPQGQFAAMDSTGLERT